MTKNELYNVEEFALLIINGKATLFTKTKIPRNIIGNDIYIYDITNDDECEFSKIRLLAKKNFVGTIISKIPFNINNNDDEIEITDYEFINEFYNLSDFLNDV